MPNTTLGSIVENLERHQQRRLAGTPTISVLAGPVGLGIRGFRDWTSRRQIPMAEAGDPDISEMVTRWTHCLAENRNLIAEAVHFLAGRTAQADHELQQSLGRKTPHDLQVFLERVLPENSPSGVETVCRWLLEQCNRGEPFQPERLAEKLDAALSSRGEPWIRVVVALNELILPGLVPAVLVFPKERPADLPSWIEAVARSLSRAADFVPTLPLGLAVEANDWTSYARFARESSFKATLRETVIEIDGLTEEAITHCLGEKDEKDSRQLSGSIRRLAADGASEELVDLFREAAVQTASPGPVDEEQDTRARSAAERFLFERLESLAETAGLFELNLKLEVRFGSRKETEVDLVSTELALAIEIDGYFHFLGPEAYRRDRRKDLELQQQGYLILRFLAEDVVARLEEILDTILRSVSFRREHAEPFQARNP